MSAPLIKSVQDKTDLRLVLPFGLGLRIGHVISVGKDGSFALQGSSESLLGLKPGKIVPPPGKFDTTWRSGEDVKFNFRAAGSGSALFPDVASVNAGFDVSFGSANAWLLAVTGRAVSAMEDTNRFRQPIIGAYLTNVWKADWAMVTGIATVEPV